jgi:hypothetical protein
MENPARQHFLALLQVAQYLAALVHDGIYYWRTEAQMDLLFAPLPVAHSDNHHFSDSVLSSLHSSNLVAFADSDWGTDKSHRRSIMGIAIMLAGAVVGYNTKYQDTVAHSSTEAEFVAACEMAKTVLFFRSILNESGISQGQPQISMKIIEGRY